MADPVDATVQDEQVHLVWQYSRGSIAHSGGEVGRNESLRRAPVHGGGHPVGYLARLG